MPQTLSPQNNIMCGTLHLCSMVMFNLTCVLLQHETIEQLLERGEKLDDLVQKTDKLSGTSKAFYKEVSINSERPIRPLL